MADNGTGRPLPNDLSHSQGVNQRPLQDYSDAISTNSSERSESPQPYSGGNTVFRQFTRSSTNADGAYPDEEASQNRLMFTMSVGGRVDQEVLEAKENDEKKPVVPKSVSWKEFWIEAFEYFKPNFLLMHLDWASLLVVSRTWLAIFVVTVLMVIGPVYRYLGQTAYLMLIAAVIETAGGVSYALAFYTCIVDLVFVLFAFTCSTIAHAISWKIRGKPTLTDIMTQLAAENLCDMGDQACLMHQLHLGKYLTTKTTVVALIGMVFSLTITGYFATQSKLFITAWLLSAITSIITTIFLNFTPTFSPWTYGRSVVIPFGFSFAVRFVLCVIWFPTTSNSKFFETVNATLAGVNGVLDNEIETLNKGRPSDSGYSHAFTSLTTKSESCLAKFALLKLDSLTVRGEIAYSRFDPGDLGEFRSLARLLANGVSGFRLYFAQILEKKSLISESGPPPSQQTGDDLSKARFKLELPLIPRRMTFDKPEENQHVWLGHKLGQRLGHTYAPAGNFESARLKQAEALEWDGMDMDDLDRLHSDIVAHYKVATDQMSAALKAVIAWGRTANSFRVISMIVPSRRREYVKLQREAALQLQNSIKNLNNAAEEVEAPSQFRKFHERYSKLGFSKSRHHSVYALSLDSFYGWEVKRLSNDIKQLASYCESLDQRRPQPCLIYPFMKTKSKAPRVETEYRLVNDDSDVSGGHTMPFNPVSHVEIRDPDSSPPRTVYDLVGVAIKNGWRVINNADVRFSSWRALVTTAASLIYVTRTTLMFSYQSKLFWVAIMVALTVSYRAVDGIYGFVVKLITTFAGGVLGMLIWYAGNGHGEGNPYGLVASCSVVMLFLSFYRHFHRLKIPMGAILLCVTTVMIAGASWIDGQLKPADTTLGRGFRVAWIRFTCVVVGLTIAFIGTLLPTPSTGKKQLRLALAGVLQQTSSIQASISGFSLQRHREEHVHVIPRQDLVLKQLRSMGIALNLSGILMNQIRYEPPLSGSWPKHRYKLLTRLLKDARDSLLDMYYLFDNIEHTERIPMILQRIGFTSVELTSSLYSVTMLCSRALASAEALPSVTTGYLTEMYTNQLGKIWEGDVEKAEDFQRLFEDRYISSDGRITLVLIITAASFYKRIDGCVRLIKGLVGEVYDVDQSLYEYDIERAPILRGGMDQD